MNIHDVSDEIRSNIHDKVVKCLDGKWKQVKPDELVIKPIVGGMINTIYYCALKDDGKSDDDQVKEVLVRFYGDSAPALRELMEKSESEEVVAAYIIGESGLGPKLHGIFPGGRIEQFIKSTQLQYHDVTCDKLNGKIARRYAHFHSLKMPLGQNRSRLFRTTEGLLHATLELKQKSPQFFPKMEMDFAQEWNWLKSLVVRLQSEFVFCHVDANQKNILVRDAVTGQDDDVIFVDFELSSYGFGSGDMAGYFLMRQFDFAKPDCNSGYDFPTEQQRRHFITEYVTTYNAINENADMNVEYILAESFFYSIYIGFVFILSFITKMSDVKSFEGKDMNKFFFDMERRYFHMKETFLSSENWEDIFTSNA